MFRDTSPVLYEALGPLVGAHPGATAAELASLLPSGGPPGERSTEVVTRALYGAHGWFRCDTSRPPRWFLASASAAPPSSSASVPPLPAPDLSAPSAGPVEVATPHRPEGGVPGIRCYPWQLDALSAWEAAGRRGVVEAVTGTGKTLLGIVAAIRALECHSQVLVLVPSVELQRQWLGELSRRTRDLGPYLGRAVEIGRLGDGGADSLRTHDVLVAVVNSARAADVVPTRQDGLLVADECHRYATPLNHVALRSGFPRRLGLSATYARDDRAHLTWLDRYFGGTCFRLGYARAVPEGVVAPFAVALVGVRLEPEEWARYLELTAELGAALARLRSLADLPTQPFEELLRVVNLLSQEDGPAGRQARRYRAALLERRRLLAETPAKLDALETLRPAFAAADRAIVFTQSIATSEASAGRLRFLGLRAAAVHSGHSTSDRALALQAFAAGELDVLAAPRVLDEGVDVPAADLGVVIGASRSRRQMVQRMGRVLRRKPDGRRARLAVLFAEGTVEDPVSGAHGTFLEEVLPVALEVRSYGPGEEAGACALLADAAPAAG